MFLSDLLGQNVENALVFIDPKIEGVRPPLYYPLAYTTTQTHNMCSRLSISSTSERLSVPAMNSRQNLEFKKRRIRIHHQPPRKQSMYILYSSFPLF